MSRFCAEIRQAVPVAPRNVVVLTLTHGYNAVRGHRTGSNNCCGAEHYLRRKKNKEQKIVHILTEANRIPQTKFKRRDMRTYVSDTYQVLYAKRVAEETETEETA